MDPTCPRTPIGTRHDLRICNTLINDWKPDNRLDYAAVALEIAGPAGYGPPP